MRPFVKVINSLKSDLLSESETAPMKGTLGLGNCSDLVTDRLIREMVSPIAWPCSVGRESLPSIDHHY
jgi:hypothetical protein